MRDVALVMALALSFVGCRAAPRRSGRSDGRDILQPAHADIDGAAEVRLTWRLFETQHWLKDGADQESAIFELLVSGGTPARVPLGRRDSSGCKLLDPSRSAPALAEVDCRRTRAWVIRSAPGELRAAFADRDAGATISVPTGADVAVDRELARIPDEAPAP